MAAAVLKMSDLPAGREQGRVLDAEREMTDMPEVPDDNSSDRDDQRRPVFIVMLGMALGLMMGGPIGFAMDCFPVGIGIGGGMGVAFVGVAFAVASGRRTTVPSPAGWNLALLLAVVGLVALAEIGVLVFWRPSP